MQMLPDPIWPVVILAIVSFGDAILCIKPVQFIKDCMIGVKFPMEYAWVFPPIKFAATAGLIAGLWIPGPALLTTVCLIVYFLIAITMHVRAKDFGRNLFLNATGMLIICVATLIISF